MAELDQLAGTHSEMLLPMCGLWTVAAAAARPWSPGSEFGGESMTWSAKLEVAVTTVPSCRIKLASSPRCLCCCCSLARAVAAPKSSRSNTPPVVAVALLPDVVGAAAVAACRRRTPPAPPPGGAAVHLITDGTDVVPATCSHCDWDHVPRHFCCWF
jgi:hypothetical protein